MTTFEELTGKFILSALLLISIFSFIIITQSENNAPDPLINNDIFNQSAGDLAIQINISTASANEKYNAFNSEEPTAGLGSIILLGVVSVGKAFSQIIMGLFTSLIKLPLLVLGIPESIYSLLLTWLIILTVVGAWIFYKLG